jgi:type VI secretion system protein VasG
MVVVDLKAMLNRLNRYCTRSLEGAAGRCVSRGNYEVALEDLLLTFLEEPSYDIPLILRHFGCDESGLRRVLQFTVERAQTGNTRRPAFSPLLLECMQDAWLLTSVEMNLAEIRSGMLMLALLTNPRRYLVDAGYEAVEAVSIEALRRDFFAITVGSPEESAPASPDGPKASKPGGREMTAPWGGLPSILPARREPVRSIRCFAVTVKFAK